MQDNSSPAYITKTWLAAATMYFVAAAATIHLTSNGRDIAALWPANAILVALLLAEEKPHWKTILSAGFVGNILANLVTRGSFLGPLLYGLSNILEIALVAALLHRDGRPDNILQSTGSLLRFLLVAGLLAPTLSGAMGAFTAHQFFGEPFGRSFSIWFASDALGLLVFTPFFFAVFRGDFVSYFVGKSFSRLIEALLLMGLTGAIAYHVFFLTAKPLLFALFPPLMAVTFRIGHIGTKAAVMTVAIIGSLATMYGHGPIVMITPNAAGQAHLLQAFLAILLLTCLPVAAEVTARARLIERLNAHHREMASQAMSDSLTGVLNRAGLEKNAKALLPNPMTGSVSLIAIDFDNFKMINDRWGHQVGDRALQHVTNIIKAHTRPNDVIGRLGGDEFIVILPHTDINAAMVVSERFQVGLRAAPFIIDDSATMLVNLSMGVASALADESYEKLLGRADMALYAAKNSGRNRIMKFA